MIENVSQRIADQADSRSQARTDESENSEEPSLFIDWQAFQRRIPGGEKNISIILNAALTELPENLEQLRSALHQQNDQQDCYTVQRLAHMIKSTARLFGVAKLHDAALRIEQSGNDVLREHLAAQFPEVDSLGESLLVQLRQRASEKGSERRI